MDNTEIAAFCKENSIELLVLFGSQAVGKTHEGSDVDVAVKIRRGIEGSKLDLIFQLGGIFKEGEIDLVLITRDTDPLLLHEIFSQGKLLYEERPGIYEEERLRAWKLYLDTEKLRRMQKDYIKKFAEKYGDVA
jgi:predicted nucleotidyltransferase